MYVGEKLRKVFSYLLFAFRGDSSIVYLDGVTPPKKAMVSRSVSSPGSLYHPKAQHHQRLLQTIREDDSGESR